MKFTGPDGLPVNPKEFADFVHAAEWIAMLAYPKLWSALRRIPPKEHILGLVEAYLRHANSDRYYHVITPPEVLPDPAIRGPAVARLRDLLLAWEPPHVTPEIRKAARVALEAEQAGPPEKPWDELVHDSESIPLEGTLIWPEGICDEDAFLASQTDAPPGPARG